MKVIRLLIFASIITYAAARVVSGPQIVDSRKKLQKRQEEDSEGVVVDDVITASNIEVFEVTTAAAIVSSSEVSVEVTSAETISAETDTNDVGNEDDADPINRYCKCSSNECNCCRDFSLPLVPIQGPGCASIRYLEGDKMSVGIKFGNRVLANRVISGSKDTPVCLPLPGGFSNFCGRVYGISKKGEEFKACLGLELRADEEVEAALRVSCFKFGPRGLKVSEAEPIPALPTKDDDDDDDDIFGFGGDDDEDEDDDILDDDDEDDDSAAAPASSDDDDDVDYTGFSLLNGDLFDELLGDDDDKPDKVPSRKVLKKKNAVKANKDKKPEAAVVGASPALNEIDGPLSNVDLSAETTKPAVASNEDSDDDDDDDDDDEEDSEGGFLSILDDLISDDDDDEDEKETEAEVSEEIEEPELEDETEENDIDDLESSVDVENEKDTQALDDLSDDEEEELQQVADDDDDDDDEEDEIEDEINNDKPSTTSLSGLSLLGFRKFFSRFFQ